MEGTKSCEMMGDKLGKGFRVKLGEEMEGWKVRLG